jgi:hypothetical protein
MLFMMARDKEKEMEEKRQLKTIVGVWCNENDSFPKRAKRCVYD